MKTEKQDWIYQFPINTKVLNLLPNGYFDLKPIDAKTAVMILERKHLTERCFDPTVYNKHVGEYLIFCSAVYFDKNTPAQYYSKARHELKMNKQIRGFLALNLKTMNKIWLSHFDIRNMEPFRIL